MIIIFIPTILRMFILATLVGIEPVNLKGD